MAIYGVGSNWNGKEMKEQFLSEGKFILGWNESSAKDLYAFVASFKVGDLLYIKGNAPGSRSLRVKGIGIITKNLIGCLTSSGLNGSSAQEWETLFVRVSWIHREEFVIKIPKNEGKLTNVRAATIYEEFLPAIQDELLAKIINQRRQRSGGARL